MTFQYPKPELGLHRKITESLLGGVFMLVGSREYDVLKEHKTWYGGFFEESFGVKLAEKNEIFYCESLAGKTNMTKNILAFIAILMYELNNQGREPVSAIETSEFTITEVRDIISGSVQFSGYVEIDRYNTRFFNDLGRLGVLQKIDEERFVFTRAVTIFLDEYENLMENIGLSES